MYVVATAGHVDHGKSRLVRALTGMEPDRLAEEKRRGLTIDLGFAWTDLPSGRSVAFVDVPGHERFLANMLAGVGPAPAVCFVVAADQGWQAQSSDHRDALAALGIEHGLVVITRADLASQQQLGDVEAEARAQLEGTPLEHAPVVVVSAADGSGLDDFVHRLDEMLAELPAPDAGARVRLWVDRSFSIRGAGTVVTGSLTAGTLRQSDRLRLVSGRGAGGAAGSRRSPGRREVSVRGLQSLGTAVQSATPHARVAVNLREASVDDVHRGDALVTPDAWEIVSSVDVRRTTGLGFTDGPEQLVVHIGTAAVQARMRPFGDDHARLALERALPLQLGDRFVLRSPGGRSVLAGALVLDVDPPPLRRRGAGARRAAALAALPASGDPAADVRRRGAMPLARLRSFGHAGLGTVPEGIAAVGADRAWWVHPPTLDHWAKTLISAVAEKSRSDPLSPGLAEGAAADVLLRSQPPLPDPSLLPLIARRAGLEAQRGVLRRPGRAAELGTAEPGVAELERRLRERPFGAPEAEDLAVLRLGTRELAAAERAGRLLRLGGGVILLPNAPAVAMQRLAALGRPFTASEARRELDTTRRVAIPLLEHLDERGWTRRLDGNLRCVVR